MFYKCNKCEKDLSADCYHKDQQRKFGRPVRCKDCTNADCRRNRDAVKSRQRAKDWQASNRDRVRSNHLQNKYNMSTQDYERLFKEQKGLCKICGKPETNSHHRTKTPHSLAVDHDHRTGKVRGLLCALCNSGLGKFKESSQLLQRAKEYIDGSL